MGMLGSSVMQRITEGAGGRTVMTSATVGKVDLFGSMLRTCHMVMLCRMHRPFAANKRAAQHGPPWEAK